MNFPFQTPPRVYTRLLVTPNDVQPRFDGFEVIGSFNPGAIEFEDGVALLIRIVERPKESRDGFIALPRWDVSRSEMVVDWLALEEVEVLDPRIVRLKRTGHIRLTFISWLLPAFSRDGVTIKRFGHTPMLPATRYETFGIEDPRLTRLNDRYYFTYVGVSQHGIVTALASTSDFASYERHGIIFCPENKDVILFPEKVDGTYIAFHRPNGNARFSQPEIWLARSPDLLHWGVHERLLGCETGWATMKVGGGTPPIPTHRGWLSLYHGHIAPNACAAAAGIGEYAAATMLQSLHDPVKILGMSSGPVMTAEQDFELSGYLPAIVFPTALIPRGEHVDVYYGAADTVTGVVRYRLEDLLFATAPSS
jgi:predicted GH43/DUF377 family glycosyl hydrolase